MTPQTFGWILLAIAIIAFLRGGAKGDMGVLIWFSLLILSFISFFVI